MSKETIKRRKERPIQRKGPSGRRRVRGQTETLYRKCIIQESTLTGQGDWKGPVGGGTVSYGRNL